MPRKETASEVDPLEQALGEAFTPADSPILTDAEIEAARAEARAQIAAAEKKKAIAAIIAEEKAKLIKPTGDAYKDELIWINIALPPFADRLVIDGKVYFQNHTYRLPRHMVASMRESMARMWDHEADIKGESLRQKLGQYRVKNFDKIPAGASVTQESV